MENLKNSKKSLIDMKGKLLHDEHTNVVYLSPWLRYEYGNQNHSDFYHRLTRLLNGIGVEVLSAFG